MSVLFEKLVMSPCHLRNTCLRCEEIGSMLATRRCSSTTSCYSSASNRRNFRKSTICLCSDLKFLALSGVQDVQCFFFSSVYVHTRLLESSFFKAWTVLDWWIGTGHSAPSWGFWDQTFCICFLFLLLIVSPDALVLLTFWHKLVMSLEARKADQQIRVMVEQFGGRHSMHRDEAWTTTLRSLAAKLLKATFAHPTM